MNRSLTQPVTQNTPTLHTTATPTQSPTWPVFLSIPAGQVTQVPEQASKIELGEDIEVWLLLGTDKEAPYVGLTNAFHLVLVNTRFAKASVISIPGNLFVYLPGHGMKRLNAAYALGGFNLIQDMLIYNFGLKPDRILLSHPTEFKWLVDDLGGLEVSVLTPIRNDCGGLPAGTHNMDGAKAYCYVAYLDGKDEIDRVRRGQQILQLLFNKLVRNGRMAALPMMYVSYQEKLETDFSLLDVLAKVPLALRVADPGRINYHLIGWDLVTEWELPDNSQTKVLLPMKKAVSDLLMEAIIVISQPSPLTEMVLTFEAQLTAAIGMTQTAQPIGTVPPLFQGTVTPTLTTTFAFTPTLQPNLTRTATPTPTTVFSPTQTQPIQPTVPTDVPYPIETPIPGSTETPYP
ncbi:MAG: LCP family protein [Anaerolineaceae bacterium]